jgi:hypothetical protein
MSFFATKFLILRSSGNNKENGTAKVAAETGSKYLKTNADKMSGRDSEPGLNVQQTSN